MLRKPLDIDALVRQAQTILGSPAATAEVEGEESGTVELVLYYTPPWPSSMKARRNLEKILAGYDEGAVHLTVRDLGEHPDLAEADGVVFSPTLIKKSPGGRSGCWATSRTPPLSPTWRRESRPAAG